MYTNNRQLESHQTITLGQIAHARSGDKGSNSNIGVIAFNLKGYEYLKHELSSEKVHHYFASLGTKLTIRYELPNLLALNFLLIGALGEGGSLSLRCDAQGKALGQALLLMPLEIPITQLQTMVRQ